MRLRNKLLVLVLIISLVPLASYFLLVITFSRIARRRVEQALKSALQARAEDALVKIINHDEDNLKMSAQAVRYSLRHYADQIASMVVASVLKFCSDSAPTDDITLVVIKCMV